VGLELGPLSLVSTIEELLERKSVGSGLENQNYGRKGSVTLTAWGHPSVKVGTYFAESGGRFVDSPLSDSGHGVILQWAVERMG
jgi:hypothetical protein